MKNSQESGVVPFPVRPWIVVPFDPEKPISVPESCMRILEWPSVSDFQVYLDRISPHDVHALRFFHNLDSSGFVSIFTQNASSFSEDAVISVTEPENGESFSMALSDFIRFCHPSGQLEDPTERETFLLDILKSFGLQVEFCQDQNPPIRPWLEISDENIETFFPETIPVFWGSESGHFTWAILSSEKAIDELHMELTPEDFVHPRNANFLQLMSYVENDLRSEGYDLSAEASLLFVRSPGGSISVPIRLIKPIVLAAIGRLCPILVNFSNEEDRIERFFRSYVSPQIPEDARV